MIEVKNLNDDNLFLYAASHYENINCYDVSEFYEDLNRIKYLKRLFSRHYAKDELKERLILNHLITLYNVFDFRAITRILFFKIEKKHWPILKTFLVFLNYMPDIVYSIGEYGNVRTEYIPIDVEVAKILRQI
jgi:hypothetical protein